MPEQSARTASTSLGEGLNNGPLSATFGPLTAITTYILSP